MTTARQDPLRAIERERARQDESWVRTKEALGRLGNVPLAVPVSTLETLRAPAQAPTAPIIVGFRA